MRRIARLARRFGKVVYSDAWLERNGKRVRERDVEGLKYFDKMMPLLERLH